MRLTTSISGKPKRSVGLSNGMHWLVPNSRNEKMSKELQTLNERIAERIGKDLVELIPADQWQRMVDHEIEKFSRDTAPKIIQELMRESYMNKAKATIDKLTQSTDWDQATQTQINAELEQFIGKSAGTIFAGMLSPSIQMVLQD